MAVSFESVLWLPVRYALERANLRSLARRDRLILATGSGYLAGSFPDGITTDEGVPTSATVRVLVRSESQALDGLLLRSTVSAPSGVWEVTGLSANMRYDVVARKAERNDVIASNVAPKV
ncbi:hypothetical protein D8I35_05275 [Corticibacter populi]|uniref:Uncharacterized protein n=1 Tax=Corticibacter populi TaxID=1550736 RepID=A0A3M6QZQ0_9BURK|nr:hypothetical protein [Corticibacter populi]RMX08490.1 hypothetical protein D8I35_05275 [Corticibacter populi]RZS35803.1 hypothetical protein EV687_0882 [Corticibacter populi]